MDWGAFFIPWNAFAFRLIVPSMLHCGYEDYPGIGPRPDGETGGRNLVSEL